MHEDCGRRRNMPESFAEDYAGGARYRKTEAGGARYRKNEEGGSKCRKAELGGENKEENGGRRQKGQED